MIINYNSETNCWQIEMNNKDENILTLGGFNNIYDVKKAWLKTMSQLFDKTVNNSFQY